MPRKQERTAVSLDIILEWSASRREARISDLSLGGCFIDCLTPIPTGERIAFKIRVSELESLAVEGEIVYVYSGLGFGVRFAPLDTGQQSLIEHLILMNGGNPWGADGGGPAAAAPGFAGAEFY